MFHSCGQSPWPAKGFGIVVIMTIDVVTAWFHTSSKSTDFNIFVKTQDKG